MWRKRKVLSHVLTKDDSFKLTYRSFPSNARLGHGNEMDWKRPQLVKALKNQVVRSVACGGYHMAAITGNSLIITVSELFLTFLLNVNV